MRQTFNCTRQERKRRRFLQRPRAIIFIFIIPNLVLRYNHQRFSSRVCHINQATPFRMVFTFAPFMRNFSVKANEFFLIVAKRIRFTILTCAIAAKPAGNNCNRERKPLRRVNRHEAHGIKVTAFRHQVSISVIDIFRGFRESLQMLYHFFYRDMIVVQIIKNVSADLLYLRQLLQSGRLAQKLVNFGILINAFLQFRPTTFCNKLTPCDKQLHHTTGRIHEQFVFNRIQRNPEKVRNQGFIQKLSIPARKIRCIKRFQKRNPMSTFFSVKQVRVFIASVGNAHQSHGIFHSLHLASRSRQNGKVRKTNIPQFLFIFIINLQ